MLMVAKKRLSIAKSSSEILNVEKKASNNANPLMIPKKSASGIFFCVLFIALFNIQRIVEEKAGWNQE